MKLDASGQVIDVETAVKDGVFGPCGPVTGSGEKPEELKRMIDELESDDIPAVFICPISLDPMVDPVTLCTGQTYDRSNIARWLSLGRLTCPTTMQDLWDDALTPNSTLRHVIHSWFSTRYLLFRKRSDDFNGRAISLVRSLAAGLKGQLRLQALRDLSRLISLHPSVTRTLSSPSSPAASALSSLLGPFTSHAVGSEAVSVIVALDLDTRSLSALSQPAKISLVADMLNEGAIGTKINCARFIGILAAGPDFSSETVSSPSLLVGLLRLVKDRRHADGVLAGLSVLRSISLHEEVRGLMVSVGAVSQIVEQLPNLSAESLQLGLEILEAMAGVGEGRRALKECGQTIPSLVRVMMRVSEGCTQCALAILWAVCEMAPDECAPAAVEAGLAAKLLLVIQSGCGQAMKQRSAELLKLCSLNYTATLFISKCKLTRTIQ